MTEPLASATNDNTRESLLGLAARLDLDGLDARERPTDAARWLLPHDTSPAGETFVDDYSNCGFHAGAVAREAGIDPLEGKPYRGRSDIMDRVVKACRRAGAWKTQLETAFAPKGNTLVLLASGKGGHFSVVVRVETNATGTVLVCLDGGQGKGGRIIRTVRRRVRWNKPGERGRVALVTVPTGEVHTILGWGDLDQFPRPFAPSVATATSAEASP